MIILGASFLVASLLLNVTTVPFLPILIRVFISDRPHERLHPRLPFLLTSV